MVKGPGLFTDIGKRAKDVLTKDYVYDQKVTLTTQTDLGVAFTASSTKKADIFAGDIVTKFTRKNITADIKVDTYSQISTTVTADNLGPGFKSVFSFAFPDPTSGKLEVQHHHEYSGISTVFGLTAVPVVEVNAAFGGEGFSLGGEAAYDTSSGAFIKYSAGLGLTKPDFTAAVLLLDRGDTLKASYLQNFSGATNTALAAEITHKFSTRSNTLTVGSSFAVDPCTIVKARLNNHGKLAALLQHEWQPKSLVTISAEVDTKALDRQAKVGLAVALKS